LPADLILISVLTLVLTLDQGCFGHDFGLRPKSGEVRFSLWS